MSHPTSRPHPTITATLLGPHDELDLSGQAPFILQLSVTLHAESPIVLYTADTILSPENALLRGGLDFFCKADPVHALSRSTINVSRTHGPARPKRTVDFVTLEPERPHIVDVPFGRYRARATTIEPYFDSHLWMATAGFKQGESYEVKLPASCKVTWWQWADLQDPESEPGRVEDGVPVLPEDEQLLITTSHGNCIGFGCVGQPMTPS